MNPFIEKLEHSLKGRIAFTTMELVRLGIFGSKQGVYNAIKDGLEHAFTSNQRIIIHRESLIEYLEKKNGD